MRHRSSCSRASAAIALVLIACAPAAAAAQALDPARLTGLGWRSIGPAHMSGRITDIAVPPRQPRVVYCATASGGLWKTVNNGTTWDPIFDHGGTGSIGAVAVSASNPDIVWIGTGEANASSYSPWGDGVYKSIDGGHNWTHMGLRDTHHIGRVVIHPTNPDIVYIAAAGHLWGPNRERGLFRTTDGGRTWRNVNFVSEDVGFIDIAMDPREPRTLYAAAYGRRSDRFDDFDSVGIFVKPGGGIFKTTDGGDTWTRLTRGLPAERVGRIGLAIADSRPAVVYAIVEVAETARVVLPEPDLERIRTLLESRSEPSPADVEAVRQSIARATPPGSGATTIVAGLSRSNQAQLRVMLGLDELDTGGGVFRSDDSGNTWRRTSPLNEREGYYSQIRVDPADAERVYVLLVRVWLSTDGGRSFDQTPWSMSSYLTSDFIHGDFHAMWIDPADSKHIVAGTDGGLYTTYDAGDTWEAHHMPIGQFVGVGVDMQRPYFVYGGLQDNGVWGGPSATRHRGGITDRDWFKPLTADGAYAQVDPTDHTRVYADSQYANLTRLDMTTGARKRITPRPTSGERLRFNYVAPFMLSPHDPATIYLGAQKLMKSTDRGDTWTAVGGDLTKGRPSPVTAEGATITTLTESPLKPGVLWVGTDDGNVQVTRDGGRSWSNVSERLPGLPRGADGRVETWVSRVEASAFEEGAAFVSFDGHRLDDFNAYLFATRDFGATWESISGDLPGGVPINVVRADRKNPNLLFAGTETAAFVSLDRGRHWVRLANGLPVVPVEDMLVHPRDADLVLGTHGRSIYVMDVSALQQATPEILGRDHLFETRPATMFDVDLTRNSGASGARRFKAPNPYSHLLDEEDGGDLAPPGASVYYHLRTGRAEPVKILIEDAKGKLVRELAATGTAGINRVDWDLRAADLPPVPAWQRVGGNDSRRLATRAARGRPGPLVEVGEYRVSLVVGESRLATTALIVEPDAPTAKAGGSGVSPNRQGLR